MTATASCTTTTSTDKRAAFFIAHLALAVFITNSEAEKSVIYGRSGTRFSEGK
jgi:hypothetical protein